MGHAKLCNEIVALAGRLERGEITAIDLILAVSQHRLLQYDEPHSDPDPEVMLALRQLASALSIAIDRDMGQIFARTLREIGFGVSKGLFTDSFFEKIRTKN